MFFGINVVNKKENNLHFHYNTPFMICSFTVESLS